MDQPTKPVAKESFQRWRNSLVTKHFLFDLANSTVGKMLDRFPMDSEFAVVREAIAREIAADIFEEVLNWKPEGVEDDE